MRPIASDRLILAALALLTVGSVGLKSAADPPGQPPAAASGQLDQHLAQLLRAQRFTTVLQPYPNRSPAVLATRGACRLSVRDASGGSSDAAIFATDAANIGPVRYLYRGKAAASPPDLAMRLARLSAEVRQRFGLAASVPIPLALASSPECGPGSFGLERPTVG